MANNADSLKLLRNSISSLYSEASNLFTGKVVKKVIRETNGGYSKYLISSIDVSPTWAKDVLNLRNAILIEGGNSFGYDKLSCIGNAKEIFESISEKYKYPVMYVMNSVPESLRTQLGVENPIIKYDDELESVKARKAAARAAASNGEKTHRAAGVMNIKYFGYDARVNGQWKSNDKVSLNEIIDVVGKDTPIYWVLASRKDAVTEDGTYIASKGYFFNNASRLTEFFGEKDSTNFCVIYIAPCIKKTWSAKLPSFNGEGSSLLKGLIDKYKSRFSDLVNGVRYADFDDYYRVDMQKVEDFVQYLKEELSENSKFVTEYVSKVVENLKSHSTDKDSSQVDRNVLNLYKEYYADEFSNLSSEKVLLSRADEMKSVRDTYFMLNELDEVFANFRNRDRSWRQADLDKQIRFIKLVDNAAA